MELDRLEGNAQEFKDKIRELILKWLELFGTEWIGLQEYTNRLGNDTHPDLYPSFGILERYGFLDSNKADPNVIIDYQLKLSERAMRFLEDDSVLKLDDIKRA